MVVNMTIKGCVDESLELSFDTINFQNVKKKEKTKKGKKEKCRGRRKKKYCPDEL